MEGYSIDKIKFKSDKTPSIEEKLTGKVITGLEKHEEIKPNAELEGKEYIQFPDGTTQLVAGESHGKGGVKMFIPDGTRIVSNSLSPTKKQVKHLKDTYDLNVSTKDSYANIITKYVNKIGLEKLYKEEEDILGLLKKQVEDETMDVSTSNVNREYISGKLSEIEQEKKAKELDKTEFFGSIFEMQELSKPENKKVLSDKGTMKFGGLSNQEFKALCEKHGLSEDVARDLLQGKMPKFQDGGEKGKILDELRLLDPTGKYRTVESLGKAYQSGEIDGKTYDRLELLISNLKYHESKDNSGTFNITTGQNTFADPTIYKREKQSKGEGAFGKITKENLPKVMENLYRNFPDIVGDEKVFGVKFNNDGTLTYNKDLDFSKVLPQVKEFQERAKKRMEASADVIINNPERFSEEQVKAAEKFKTDETFDESIARGVDSKLGQFTSGRFNLGVDVVTPEEKAELEKQGIYTVNQLKDAYAKNPKLLSEDSKKRLDDISSMMGDNADFTLNPIKKYPEKQAEEPDEETNETEISTDVRLPRKEYPRLFGSPYQIPLPPSGMQSHLMGETRLQRMDPIKIGIEPQIQEAGVQREFAAKQYFGNLAPNVAASAFANTLASQTKSINEAARIAHVTNAQNAANTELFNIGQAGQEQEANLRNKMSFEQRQYLAQSKTEEELRNWLDQVRKIHVTNYKNNQQLNLMNQMFPSVNLNSAGNQVDYDPNDQWQTDQYGRRYKILYGDQAVKS